MTVPNSFLTKDEFENLRSQIVTSSWGGARYLSMAFTEQGVCFILYVLSAERIKKINPLRARA